MIRLLPLAAAIATSAAMITATAGHAAPLGFYTATPATAPARTSLLTHATPWRLQGATYIADRAPERAEVLCQLVAQRVGQLSAFSAAGAPFDADALAKCNSKAKPVAGTAVATR